MNQFNTKLDWKYIIDLNITELYPGLLAKNDILEYAALKNQKFLVQMLYEKSKLVL
jgi:hypothetical protein